MKKCKDCKQKKSKDSFYGIQGECKKCTQKRVSKNYFGNREHYINYEKKREQNPERKRMKLEYQRKRRLKFPGKNKARDRVHQALKKGLIVRKPCEVCGDKETQAHHEDYRKYLQVLWLCRKHHMETENKKSFLP